MTAQYRLFIDELLPSVAFLTLTGQPRRISATSLRHHTQVVKGQVCKTSMPRFESGWCLHFTLRWVTNRRSIVLQEAMLNFALLGAEWVLWLLVILSIIGLTITIERLVFFFKTSTDSGAVHQAIQSFLADGDLATLQQHVGKLGGYEANILSSGTELHSQHPGAIEKAMVSTAKAERLRMERGLAYLATIGSNAPFIGLFGTVLGVIGALSEMDQGNMEAWNAVIGGIYEALVATAVGLMVAIPAVVLYNGFQRWIKNRLGRTESLADLILAQLASAKEPDVR